VENELWCDRLNELSCGKFVVQLRLPPSGYGAVVALPAGNPVHYRAQIAQSLA
jgi:hypothetical protein